MNRTPKSATQQVMPFFFSRAHTNLYKNKSGKVLSDPLYYLILIVFISE